MPDLEPARQTARGYEIGELIGKGGFGSVYRAYQPIVNRDVALKIILPAYANNPLFIRQFELEAQVIARLEHPHIVPLYDYWREPDRAYLVMRLLRGGNLRKLILTNPNGLPLALIAVLLNQITSALYFAHIHEVIHQDIKPENILLDEQGNTYLSDFGIAKSLLNKDPEKGNYVFGSPEYMSPEAATRESTSARSDIYSLGIMLYELLTGTLPYVAHTNQEYAQEHVFGNIPPVSLQRPDIPEKMNEVIWQATDKLPTARYLTAVEFAEAFYRIADIPNNPITFETTSTNLTNQTVVESQQLGTMVFQQEAADIRNPYKGLRAFEEIDAADFFGREALITKILGRLEQERFIAIVGPSGSGKSSVIRAGVMPSLRLGKPKHFQNALFLTMAPGASPIQELEAGLLKIATHTEDIRFDRTHYDSLKNIGQKLFDQTKSETLIFIDQFEEVFTLVTEESERNYFLQIIAAAVDDPQCHLHILITLRADLYDRPLLYPTFGKLIQAHTEVVLPLSPKELEYAIIGPAQRANANLESVLLVSIIADVIRQPGALPLLQYTLTELFENRHTNILSLDTYNRLGGLSGTLTRRADELYMTLNTEEQRLAQYIFLRLISIVEGSEPVRRRLSQADLLTEQSAERKATIQKVLEIFHKQRFLTFDHDPVTRTPTVEIAHEALIREWSRFQEWIAANRDEIRIQRQLTIGTHEWLNSNRESSFLARGAKLTQFKSLNTSAHEEIGLNSDELGYLKASISLNNRMVWYRRLIAGALVILMVLAMVFATLALSRANQAENQRNRANRQANIARSRELAASALANVDQIDLALLLSLESLRTSNTFEARNSLVTSLQIEPRLEAYFHGHTDLVRTVAYSPDGRYIASGGRDNRVILWDAASHTLLNSLMGHEDWINSVAFSPDSSLLASGSADGTVRLWDVASGQLIGQPLNANMGAVWSVSFSPNGKLLAGGGEDGLIQLWDVATRQPTHAPLAGHADIVYSVAFSPDSARLASGSADNTIRLWDVETGQSIGNPLEGHSNWVFSVVFHPNGSILASAGADKTIILWRLDFDDPAQSSIIYTFDNAHTDWIRSLAFDSTGNLLASASADHTVKFWSVGSSPMVPVAITVAQSEVWSVSFSPDATSLVSTDVNSVVLLKTTIPFLQTDLLINDLALSPDQAKLAVASGGPAPDDGIDAITIWDTATNQLLYQLGQHSGPVTSVAFSPDGTWLASSSVDQSIILWDTTSYQPQKRITVSFQPLNPVWVVAFSPDSQILASASDDGQVMLWDVETGQPIGEPLRGHTGGVMTVAFSPDGKILATGGTDNTVRLWNIEDQTAIAILEGHTDSVLSLAFSRDGRYLASGSRDKTIRLWRLTSRSSDVFLGHASWVTDLIFTSDGQALVSSGRDGQIMLWDVPARSLLGQPYHGDNLWFTSLVLDDTKDTIVSGSRTGEINFWEIGLAESRACQIANRDLTPQEKLRYLDNITKSPICSLMIGAN